MSTIHFAYLSVDLLVFNLYLNVTSVNFVITFQIRGLATRLEETGLTKDSLYSGKLRNAVAFVLSNMLEHATTLTGRRATQLTVNSRLCSAF